MKQNNFLNREVSTIIHFLLLVLIAIVFIGCGARQTPPAQSKNNISSMSTPVEIIGYSLIKSNEKLPYRSALLQITNNRITNNDDLLGPPNNSASAKDGHQFVVIAVNIATKNKKKWIDTVASAQLVDQNGKVNYLELWYINGAFRPRQFFPDNLSGFNPDQQTKLAFYMEDPLPPKLKLIIQNRDLGFLEDIAK